MRLITHEFAGRPKTAERKSDGTMPIRIKNEGIMRAKRQSARDICLSPLSN